MTEKRYKQPIPVSLDQVYARQEQRLEQAGIQINEKAEVRLSALVFQNPLSKRSVSIHFLQSRLDELGFDLAKTDKDGWFSEGTKTAVMGFQEQNGLPITGLVDEHTLLAIFDGVADVKVIID